MQAIILAGGFGTRLKSVTGDVPKPMARVAGRPFIGWLLEYMAGEGVREAVLCLHHRADAIIAYAGHRFAGIDITYSIESAPLGTGGAIAKAMRQLNPSQPVFVINGDSLVMLNYWCMMQHHVREGRTATLATFEVPDCSRYSKLTLRQNRITRYDVLGDAAPGHISAGFYVLAPQVFAHASTPTFSLEGEGKRSAGGGVAFSFERDFLHPNVPAIKPAYYDAVDYFIDIGVPHDYARAQSEIPALLSKRMAI